MACSQEAKSISITLYSNDRVIDDTSTACKRVSVSLALYFVMSYVVNIIAGLHRGRMSALVSYKL